MIAVMTTHRDQMITRLVDAAESLLSESDALTAGAVADRVGVARNSLYRYIGSIEDLRGLVIQRHLLPWVDAVDAAVAGAGSAREKLAAYLTENVEQAAVNDHRLLTHAADATTSQILADVDEAHLRLRNHLTDLCHTLDPETGRTAAHYVQALLQAGFTELDRGATPGEVAPRVVAAALAVIGALAD